MFALGMFACCTAQAYPVTYTNCGVEHTLQKAPEKIIGQNQGVVEFLLGLGLGDKIIGTRPLDDAIWPRYAEDFEHVKIHLNPDWWNYPNESTVVAEQADFIIGSWMSSFREAYVDEDNNSKGLFSPATVGPCTGLGSQQHEDATDGPASKDNYRTCRPQLNQAGIGTWLPSDACENHSIRANVTALGEEFVYEEMRRIGNLFQLDVEPKITEMKNDFDKAAALVAVAVDTPLTAIWVDCVSCCKVDEGEEQQVYVGAGSGTLTC
jgi:iron complex transport system substrate-binding protein